MSVTVELIYPPTGEIRTVQATPEILTPLMVEGWTQYKPSAEVTPEVPTNVQ